MYISKTLTDQLYIFQYPNKKTGFNIDTAEVVKSCIKPLNQDVKIDFALNTASSHYDAFKGEQFAIAADGQVSSFNLNRMMKINRLAITPETQPNRSTIISQRNNGPAIVHQYETNGKHKQIRARYTAQRRQS